MADLSIISVPYAAVPSSVRTISGLPKKVEVVLGNNKERDGGGCASVMKILHYIFGRPPGRGGGSVCIRSDGTGIGHGGRGESAVSRYFAKGYRQAGENLQEHGK